MKEQDEAIEESLSHITHKLIVMSGKGGVGKSTVAVNLAAALAHSHFKVGLMDADLHGPSVPTMLGLEGQLLQSDSNKIMPLCYQENLKVISIGSLLSHKDAAVIWRGPLKIGAIKQFISDVEWGSLDFLIVDSPPGTGDEPLTVAQTIKGASALIVTTPQEVSLIDVRKCIDFCRQVGLPIIGLIENMSGFICPHCDRTVDVFKKGGGEQAARESAIPFLGSIPMDSGIVESGDRGRPYFSEKQFTSAYGAFLKIIGRVTEILNLSPVSSAK
jgi:Mrp family chromosome partitioning ATPase